MFAVVNAAERFFAASRGGDIEAAITELADDVILLTPRSDDPVVGREAAGAFLRAVEGTCDEFRHTHVLVGGAADQSSLIALVFEARVGEQTLRGVDLIELDDNDRIATFTVAARPVAAVRAIGERLGGGV